MKSHELEPGQKFGMWTVVAPVEDTSGKVKKYVCRCVCGTKRKVLAASLVGKRSKSCGCWIKAAHNQVMGKLFPGSNQRRAEFEKRKTA